MAKLKDIIRYSNECLGVSEFEDYCPNGVQVEGGQDVGHIVSGVSASYELFNKALAVKADLVLVHHGIIWGSGLFTIEGSLRKRLKILLENNITLMAYHLPLDANPHLGNNVIFAKKLGISKDLKSFGKYKGKEIGYIGNLNKKMPFSDIRARVKDIVGSETACYAYGEDMVERVAVITGAGQDKLVSAKRAGAQLFITGEASEPTMHIAKEEKINFIASGHYNTEKFGVIALGEHLKKEFNVLHTFIDVPGSV